MTTATIILNKMQCTHGNPNGWSSHYFSKVNGEKKKIYYRLTTNSPKFDGDGVATWRLPVSYLTAAWPDAWHWSQPVSDARSRRRWWPARVRRPMLTHGWGVCPRDRVGTTPRQMSGSAASAVRRSATTQQTHHLHRIRHSRSQIQSTCLKMMWLLAEMGRPGER